MHVDIHRNGKKEEANSAKGAGRRRKKRKWERKRERRVARSTMLRITH